ncbi:MAG: two pore domain potassium channel family protein [Dehalococcoidia bacterium]|nr:two pore domain potassium channel family protein [Dehalococcoidia bacterium]
MVSALLAGGAVSVVNFAIHGLTTALVVITTRHTANLTRNTSLFSRVTALLTATVSVLMVAHVIEITVWSTFYRHYGIYVSGVPAFDLAFENYVALGYGDVVPNTHFRLIGPMTALNGLLLIGWSVAIIFEVLRMAELSFHRGKRGTG